jgi:hypothetical protein
MLYADESSLACFDGKLFSFYPATSDSVTLALTHELPLKVPFAWNELPGLFAQCTKLILLFKVMC